MPTSKTLNRSWNGVSESGGSFRIGDVRGSVLEAAAKHDVINHLARLSFIKLSDATNRSFQDQDLICVLRINGAASRARR